MRTPRFELTELGFGPGQRFARSHLAFSTPIWTAFCGAITMLGAALGVIAAFDLMPGAAPTPIGLLGVALVVFVGVVLILPRPRVGSAWSHVVLSAVYIGPAAAMVAFAPHGASVLSAAMFVGPLVAVWVTDRRLIAAHLTAASVCLLLPSLVGITDQGTLFATLRLLPSLWFLGGLCVVVLEAAEAQGAELERLARRDPLTGIGNRRLLDECLAEELDAHAARDRQLTVLALDLDGFKSVNDHLGHAAGDALLSDVARILRSTVRSYDTVVRQGGDEFVVVLPETDQAGAARVATDVRQALHALEQAGPVAVSTGIGIATFPADGRTPDALLAAADARLLSDKRTAPAAPVLAGSEAGDLTAAAPPPMASPEGSAFKLDISRHALAGHRLVWTVTGLLFVINAVLAIALVIREPQFATPALPYVAAMGAVVGVAVLISRPPVIGSLPNHLVIALGYLTPLATLLACQPGGSVGIGSSIFIGPLAAARLTSRTHIAGHLAAASALFLGSAVTGLVDAPTVLGILLLVASFWLLGACVAVVLEVAERQGQELQQLVRRDPLTGAANRRHLDEWLARQLARAERSGRAVSVIAFDLNGFKALNDAQGHAAGDRVLQEVATRLGTLAGDDRLLARLGGDEFVLVVPGATADEAEECARQAVRELAQIDCGGAPLTTGVGIATSPIDARSTHALLGTADARLIAHKARHGAPRARRTPRPQLGLGRSDEEPATS